MNLIDIIPGFVIGWSAAFAFMLCRDAGDFDALKAWWENIKSAFHDEYRAGRWD